MDVLNNKMGKQGQYTVTTLNLLACLLSVLSNCLFLLPAPVHADDLPAWTSGSDVTAVVGRDGKSLLRINISGRPPAVKMQAAATPNSNDNAGAYLGLSNVPAFDWSYGCSATAAAMLFGYYDLHGYPNMYTGPAGTPAGACPLNNSVWGSGECTISASHLGKDGRITRGHVDDYWISYNSGLPDPYISGSWTAHTPHDCTGDYMGTNQYNYGNPDGSTSLYTDPNGDRLYDCTDGEPAYRDLCHGLRLFAESKGYTVTTNYTQLIRGVASDPAKGFTFANYCAEIDAGRPVLIYVTNHTMLGYGYETTGNVVYLHDTWDYSNHAMTWGSSYSGLQHLGVHVIQLATAQTAPTVTNSTGATNITATSATLNGNLTSVGSQTTTVTVYYGTADGGTIPGSWAHNVPLGAMSTGVFSTKVAGLTPYATYFYRCSATNSSGTAWAASSSSLVAQTQLKLLGADDVASVGNLSPNYLVFSSWVASASGNLNQIRVKCGAPGNVKVALYDDSSGSPGTLLSANNTGQAVISGWNIINLSSPASIIAGTTYWLATNSDTPCVNHTTGGSMAHRAATYSGFSFPSSAGSGFWTGAYYSIAQGWGTPPSAPGAAPELLSPGTAITFIWGTSTRASNYWLQVNTSQAFTGTNIINADIGNLTLQEVTGFSLGTTYYWRVKAGNDSGWSAWSPTRGVLVSQLP